MDMRDKKCLTGEFIKSNVILPQKTILLDFIYSADNTRMLCNYKGVIKVLIRLHTVEQESQADHLTLILRNIISECSLV